MHAEEPDRQQGSGHLILSDGTEVPVEWEIYLLPDATIRSGIVRGDPMRLLMAAENRLVILRLDASKAAAIAIEGRSRVWRLLRHCCSLYLGFVLGQSSPSSLWVARPLQSCSSQRRVKSLPSLFRRQ